MESTLTFRDWESGRKFTRWSLRRLASPPLETYYGYVDGYLEVVMKKRYSIAEARNNLARIVHTVEDESEIVLTRRGRPVAVLVSFSAFQRLMEGRPGLWTALERFRSAKERHIIEENLCGAFEGVRDRSSGREPTL